MKYFKIIIATCVALNSVAAQDLDYKQDEAVYDLKRVMRENASLVQSIRSNKNNDPAEIKQLIDKTETALKECSATSVPDTYNFTVTNYADNSKLSFSIKDIRNELSAWRKKADNALLPVSENKLNAKPSTLSTSSINTSTLSPEQQNVANKFREVLENRYEDILNMNKCIRDKSISGSVMWLGEVYTDVQKANIPDDYVFELKDNDGKTKESITAGSLKTLVPQWLNTAKHYDDILEKVDNFDQAYSRVCWDLQKMKDGDKTVIEHAKSLTIDPFDKAIQGINEMKVSGNFEVGYGTEDVPKTTVSKAIQQWPEWKSYLTATYEKAKAEREALLKSFRDKLSGDKLRLFDKYYGPAGTDGEGGKAVTTPEGMAAARIWTSGTVDMEHYIQPRWTLTVFSFEGMKLVGTHTEWGWGYNIPNSYYKWRKD